MAEDPRSLLIGNPFSPLLQSSYFWGGLTSRLLCFFCSHLLTEFCCWESLRDRHSEAQLALWLGSHTPSSCGERILHSAFLASFTKVCRDWRLGGVFREGGREPLDFHCCPLQREGRAGLTGGGKVLWGAGKPQLSHCTGAALKPLGNLPSSNCAGPCPVLSL